MVTQIPDGSLEFCFFRPEVQQVSLAGDFNGWQTCFFMKRNSDGWWKCRLRLAPGIYEFRYSADGKWYTDYAAFGLAHGPFGFNSVVKVDPPTVPQLKTIPAQSDSQIQAA